MKAKQGDRHYIQKVALAARHGAPPLDARHDISLEQIAEHIENDSALMVDARSPASFDIAHVRGAINVPAGEMEEHGGQVPQNVSADQLIIIYCASSSCGAADVVYDYLAAQGYTNMRVYKPGWEQLALVKNLH